MKRVKLIIMGAAVLALTLVAGCGTQPQPAAAPAPAPAPATSPAPAATPTAAEKKTANFVGEATCKGCHQMSNFDKTKHVGSFKPLSAFQLAQPFGELSIFDGANKDPKAAKTTKVDLSKAIGIHMDSNVVVEVPKEAGFAAKYYRVGSIKKGSDGKYTFTPNAKEEGKEDIAAEDYSSCAACHAPGLGKPGKPDMTVTCEACHGPGGDHVKAATPEEKAATIKIPNTQTCEGCHKPDPAKDAKTGAITVNNHYGDRNFSLSPHTSGQLNGCLTCHKAHGPNANGLLLRQDDPNKICETCHGVGKMDVGKIMFKNTSDAHGHTTADHSFNAVPLSALTVNKDTKAMEITDKTVLENVVKKKLPNLFK